MVERVSGYDLASRAIFEVDGRVSPEEVLRGRNGSASSRVCRIANPPTALLWLICPSNKNINQPNTIYNKNNHTYDTRTIV